MEQELRDSYDPKPKQPETKQTPFLSFKTTKLRVIRIAMLMAVSCNITSVILVLFTKDIYYRNIAQALVIAGGIVLVPPLLYEMILLDRLNKRVKKLLAEANIRLIVAEELARYQPEIIMSDEYLDNLTQSLKDLRRDLERVTKL